MSNQSTSAWRDEKVCARVKELWVNHSATQISDILAREKLAKVSRNAIVGWLHRQDVTIEQKTSVHPSTRDNGTPRVRRTDAVSRLRPAPQVKPQPFVIQCTEVVPLNISFTDLQDGDCRFPYGDNALTMTYCGLPSLTGHSWCRSHFHIVTVPTPARKPPQPFVSQAGAPSRFGGGVAA
jgi:hypothetical protein